MEKTPFPTTLDELETYPQADPDRRTGGAVSGLQRAVHPQPGTDRRRSLGLPGDPVRQYHRIPRLGFIYFMRYGRTSVQKRSYK